MSCPTCDHTMQNIGVFPETSNNKIFWCPRCGTIKSVYGDFEEVSNTIWTRNIISCAQNNLKWPQQGREQKAITEAEFEVKESNQKIMVVLNSIKNKVMR